MHRCRSESARCLVLNVTEGETNCFFFLFYIVKENKKGEKLWW